MNRRTDSETFDLIDAVDARLLRLLFRLGMPAAECEDYAQDVWLAFLLGHGDGALEKPDVQAWLRGVARKKALDHHRRHHRNPIQSLDEDGVIEANGKEGTDDEAEEKLGPMSPILSAIRDALNELTPASRDIFLFHARDGFDYAHIGEIVGLTPARVRARYSRALKELRERLASDPPCMDVRGGGGRVGRMGILGRMTDGLRADESTLRPRRWKKICDSSYLLRDRQLRRSGAAEPGLSQRNAESVQQPVS